MAELAEVEDAATEAAFQVAQAGDQVPPPATKTSPPVIQEPPAVPISVEDTPPDQQHLQGMLIQQFANGQLIFNFQLENMVLMKNRSATLLDLLSMTVNGLQKNMSKCCVKHLKLSMSNIGIEKLEKKLREPIENMFKAWQIGEPALMPWVSKHIQQYLKVHLQRAFPVSFSVFNCFGVNAVTICCFTVFHKFGERE